MGPGAAAKMAATREAGAGAGSPGSPRARASALLERMERALAPPAGPAPEPQPARSEREGAGRRVAAEGVSRPSAAVGPSAVMYLAGRKGLQTPVRGRDPWALREVEAVETDPHGICGGKPRSEALKLALEQKVRENAELAARLDQARGEARSLRAAVVNYEGRVEALERELARRGGDPSDVQLGAAGAGGEGGDPFGKVRGLCDQMGEAVTSVCGSLSLLETHEAMKEMRRSREEVLSPTRRGHGSPGAASPCGSPGAGGLGGGRSVDRLMKLYEGLVDDSECMDTFISSLGGSDGEPDGSAPGDTAPGCALDRLKFLEADLSSQEPLLCSSRLIRGDLSY